MSAWLELEGMPNHHVNRFQRIAATRAERASPACMQAEAVAVANGDPTMIGYLCGNNFDRGFPLYVRDFNANYLALPALPSARAEGAGGDPAVVVRTIDAGPRGLYAAVVNTAPTARQVTVRLPAGAVTALASGAAVPRAGAGG